ncbi:NADH:flavin oxidoreductase [Formosa maritima]|uniref:NADH:flavin oxidoreductase n=1 Tax=Formosa maritima TaxID=2592046 RepID=A0A5D0G825_9FLAO|nr:NADH:flavin oxidoreductase [Formosa maritima]TYA54800.1 NADH:flavin oxidoreductase [Formosa maritima]
MDNKANNILTSGNIGNLVLKNRIIKAGCFEGMSQNGGVTPELIEHHRKMAAGGTAMTTVAYCSVSKDGRAYGHEMWMRKELIPELKSLTSKIQAEAAYASIQLGHCGYFASKQVIGKRSLGASSKFNLFRMSIAKKMKATDIQEKITDFINATSMAIEAGFDAVEIHAGHGYLISQFLSPYTNNRKDEYGGSLENRLRFPLEIIKGIRKKVGTDFPILIKMNLYDGIKGGLEINEAIEIAKAFETEGASALIPSSGFTSKTPFLMLRGRLPIFEMVANQSSWLMKLSLALFGKLIVQEYTYTRLFHLKEAKKIKTVVNIPVIYIGGIKTSEDVEEALQSGFDFVQIGRALIHDNNFVNHIAQNSSNLNICDTCNRCVAAMDGGGVYCVSKVTGNYVE